MSRNLKITIHARASLNRNKKPKSPKKSTNKIKIKGDRKNEQKNLGKKKKKEIKKSEKVFFHECITKAAVSVE